MKGCFRNFAGLQVSLLHILELRCIFIEILDVVLKLFLLRKMLKRTNNYL